MSHLNQVPWWGAFHIAEGTCGKWEIGPSTLWLIHRSHEWAVVHRPSTDNEDMDHSISRSAYYVPASGNDCGDELTGTREGYQVRRYSFRDPQSDVSLTPALADRPIVSRPESTLFVPPHESVTLYLSTPLWIQIRVTESGRQIAEMPSFRMSDTWFGPSTIEGELCYATRTSGRLRRDDVPARLNRAITPLRVLNTGNDPLELVRVQLPAPYLALYKSDADELWTEAVTMTRSDGVEGAEVEIVTGAPPEVRGASRITGPRQTLKKNLFTSTFGAVGSLLST
ncbi:MAG: hypothetical protein COV99_07365 [Bacteroidetes bacterium CG12_big_fil_rev_8_21_14_0_65_60_17]|nr:MAG: hypothetical protein COV99_07365 [Bacteroidetes bacterium CG12_big_fil_rev_8_21_14_0_65_60_17]